MNEEIFKFIKQGESETSEFKEQYDNEVEETVGAFANTKGGIILIGISDNGKIKGVSISKETLKNWVNKISQNTNPRIIPDIESVKINDKNIVTIKIKEFPFKPVAVSGRCYKRIRNSNRQMTPTQIAEMHLHSTGSSWDVLPAQNSLFDEINLEQFKEYIKKAKATGRRKFEEKSLIQTLQKLELLKDKKPTWASIILFGKYPQQKLSQAKIHCGRFKQETKIIDDQMIAGTVFTQIENVMDFVRKNINVRLEITGKPERKEIWDYPLEALREAVLNAICHRDYTANEEIQIKIYDDRITIWNPGGLPAGITIEELYNPNHPSRPRNKLIAQIFFDVGLIEKYGSGIQRIISACKEAGIPQPTFEEKFGGFIVEFRKDIYTEEYLKKLGLNERQIKAVMYVKEKEKITNKDYLELTNISRITASRELQDLVEKNVLKKIGKVGKGTKYILKVS
ncbi:MAG: helix-turn-helix domain-containing protein, partial [Elusimicrobiota bacterium]